MKIIKSLGFIALAAIIGFSMIACGESGNGERGTDPLFSVSGQFPSAISGNAKFQVQTEETVPRSAITTYDLSGELEDGDLLLKLRGSFNLTDGSYTVSAAASFLRYTINGRREGNNQIATATAAIKDNNDVWSTHIVSVTITTIEVREGDGTEEQGLPEWAWGNWEHKWTKSLSDKSINSTETWSYFTPWYYERWTSHIWQGHYNGASTKYTVIEVNPVEGLEETYDVIFAYPRYLPTEDQLKTASASFFQSIGASNPDEHWPVWAAPWEFEVIFNSYNDDPFDPNKTIWWYICDDPAHAKYGEIIIINWDTFTEIMIEKELGEFKPNGDFDCELWQNNWDNDWDSYPAKDAQDRSILSAHWWERMEMINKFFEDNGIITKAGGDYTKPQARFYWGWYREGFVFNQHNDPYHENSNSKCAHWAPAEDWETFWDTPRYYIRWLREETDSAGINFLGNWEQYDFSKWWTDDYLNRYLVSQGVQPNTWYTKVRIWVDEWDHFVFQYYNGRNDSMGQGAPCDSKDFNYVKNLPYEPDHWEHSNFYQRYHPEWDYEEP